MTLNRLPFGLEETTSLESSHLELLWTVESLRAHLVESDFVDASHQSQVNDFEFALLVYHYVLWLDVIISVATFPLSIFRHQLELVQELDVLDKRVVVLISQLDFLRPQSLQCLLVLHIGQQHFLLNKDTKTGRIVETVFKFGIRLSLIHIHHQETLHLQLHQVEKSLGSEDSELRVTSSLDCISLIFFIQFDFTKRASSQSD